MDETSSTTSAADGTSTGAELPPEHPPDCGTATVVDAQVWIGGPEDERESLVGARVVDGDLIISGADDVDLGFLACLDEVTGDLYVHDNDALRDADGLYWLEALGGNLVVTRNDALVDFSGLANVLEIAEGRSMIVSENAALERISGLASLVVVRGDLLLRDNPLLTDVTGLHGLGAVLGALAINHNGSLCESQIEALVSEIEIPEAPTDAWTNRGNAQGC